MDDPAPDVLALFVGGPHDGRRMLVPGNEWDQPSMGKLTVEGAVYWLGIARSEHDQLWRYYWQEAGVNRWMT